MIVKFEAIPTLDSIHIAKLHLWWYSDEINRNQCRFLYNSEQHVALRQYACKNKIYLYKDIEYNKNVTYKIYIKLTRVCTRFNISEKIN